MSHHATHAVTGSWSLPLDDRPTLAEVRNWVRQRLVGIVAGDTLEDILLVVVELVTNAEVHTHSPQRLSMSHRPGTVLIEVSDGDPAQPVLRPRSKTRSGGRGIFLVDALSTDWGTRRHPDGKAVWSHIVLSDPARPTP